MQEFIKEIIYYDKTSFIIINRLLQTPILDFLTILFRNPGFWIPLYGFIITKIFILRGLNNGFWLIVGLLLTFLITDQISASIIKPFVMRLRPCNDPEIIPYMISRIKCGSGFSFVSSHAANHFGLSLYLGKTIFKEKWQIRLLLFWAFIVSFSQVYVGAHFPLDVIFGGIIGLLIGILISSIINKYKPFLA